MIEKANHIIEEMFNNPLHKKEYKNEDVKHIDSAVINNQVRDIIHNNSKPGTQKSNIRNTLESAINARQMYNCFNLYDPQLDISPETKNKSKTKKKKSANQEMINYYKDRRKKKSSDPTINAMYKRFAHIKDDNNTCYLCGKHIGGRHNYLHVEHKIPSDTLTILTYNSLQKRKKSKTLSSGFKYDDYIKVNTDNNFEGVKDYLYTLFAYAHAQCNINKSNSLFVRFEFDDNKNLITNVNEPNIKKFVLCCKKIPESDRDLRTKFLINHFSHISTLITQAKISKETLVSSLMTLAIMLDDTKKYIETKYKPATPGCGISKPVIKKKYKTRTNTRIRKSLNRTVKNKNI